jgi:oligosaccharide reducing-end xylanase
MIHRRAHHSMLAGVGAKVALVCLTLSLAGVSLQGAETTKRPRDLFAELLGKPQSEIDAKISMAWSRLFAGDDQNERVYFPVGGDMAYVADIGHQDVRTEGMSYAMTICVVLGKHQEFDRIWRWAKTHMYHENGRYAGYFAWECSFDGTQMDPQPAPDGEEWFATALLFAARKWGNGPGVFNYQAEADRLLRDMRRHRPGVPESLFSGTEKQVVYSVDGVSATFTDPSYQLPGFYEIWARWGDPEGQAFWRDAAVSSRRFFRKVAHPLTGLMPECCGFDGKPHRGDLGDFRFDACRTLANVALDWAWFGRDDWSVVQSNRVLGFLKTQGHPCPNQFSLAGKPLSDVDSTGLDAMASVAGLAADPAIARPFVQYFWDRPIPSGKWRYYDGLLYFLALLETSGRFHPVVN